MRTFYHATPVRNLPSILRHGLLKSKSRGKMKAVWFVRSDAIAWACMHVAWRHHVPITEVVVLQITVEKGKVRSSHGGLRYTLADVPPERFGVLQTFALVARAGGADGRANARKPRGV